MIIAIVVSYRWLRRRLDSRVAARTRRGESRMMSERTGWPLNSVGKDFLRDGPAAVYIVYYYVISFCQCSEM